MLQDILNFFQSIGLFINGLIDLITGVIDLVVQLFSGLVGLLRWTTVALDVGRELNFIVPFDLASVFSMFCIVSVFFAIFGRIK